VRHQSIRTGPDLPSRHSCVAPLSSPLTIHVLFLYRLGANRDMASAQQIDFHEDVAEWLKQVGGNARKVSRERGEGTTFLLPTFPSTDSFFTCPPDSAGRTRQEAQRGAGGH
jgi:hypothetical protein